MNHPLYQVVRLAAPSLVLGNTMLLEHAGIATDDIPTSSRARPCKGYR